MKARAVLRVVLWAIPVVAIVGGAIYAFRPQPIPAELTGVVRGPLEVAVVEDGQTRIRERYDVYSPVGGRLLRIHLRPGDLVTADETILAVIEPASPALLDAREISAAEARVEAARLAVQRATSRLDQTRIAADLAETQLARIVRLVETRAVPVEQRESAEAEYRTRAEELRAAQFDIQIAEFELRQAEAALLHITGDNDSPADRFFEIRPPTDGRVLNVYQESATVVTPGMRLMQLGDPSDLEVVIDVLSTDAVRVQPGNTVRLEQWGGPFPLQGVVRVVEPSAFTKISALGVEEQRVNVIVDLVTPADQRRTLGDGYRVEARIIIWQDNDVLQIPTGALFRHGDRWAVFVERDGRAHLQEIEIGQRNPSFAQVVDGLSEGDSVLLHPSDRIADGVRIETM